MLQKLKKIVNKHYNKILYGIHDDLKTDEYGIDIESIQTCDKCGFEFCYDGTCRFYIDNSTSEIYEYMILFSTTGIDRNANIKGSIAQSYCPTCNKRVNTYIIENFNCSEEKAINIVKDAIKFRKQLFEANINHRYTIIKKNNYFAIKSGDCNRLLYKQEINENNTEKIIISKLEKEIQRMIKIDYEFHKINLEKDKNINKLIIIANNEKFDDKIKCPKCNTIINKRVYYKSKCPYCDGTMEETYFVHFD